MKEQAAQIFLNGIKDTKGLYRLIDQLEAISKELYHNQEGFITQKLKGRLLASIEAIFVWLEQNNLEPSGDGEQRAFIEEIIAYLKKIPQVRVTLAFEPDDLFTDKLNEQISALVNRRIILDISVNHHIVGGVVLEYGGKHRDYSVEPKVDRYLKDELPRILEPEKEVA